MSWIHLPCDFVTFESPDEVTRWLTQYARVYAFIIGVDRAARA